MRFLLMITLLFLSCEEVDPVTFMDLTVWKASGPPVEDGDEDRPGEEEPIKLCAWNTNSMGFCPGTLEYGKGFSATGSFSCVKKCCESPEWTYFWTIKAWDPDAAGGSGDMVTIYDGHAGGSGDLGIHGCQITLPENAAEKWWNKSCNKKDYDLSQGLSFYCKVQCADCGARETAGGTAAVSGY